MFALRWILGSQFSQIIRTFVSEMTDGDKTKAKDEAAKKKIPKTPTKKFYPIAPDGKP